MPVEIPDGIFYFCTLASIKTRIALAKLSRGTMGNAIENFRCQSVTIRHAYSQARCDV